MIYRIYPNAAPDTLGMIPKLEVLAELFDLIQSAENRVSDWESHLHKSSELAYLPGYYSKLNHKIEIRKMAIARLRQRYNKQLEILKFS